MKTNVLAAICASEVAYASIPYTETGTNHQRFSDTVNAAGLAGYQNAAWCATYQFAVELETVGAEQALKNWNMTKSNYCGYSVFETESMFAKAGKTGSKPKPGALVIFRQSHMGRVLAVDGDYFTCGEGNTSNAAFNRDGDACAVKTYKADNPKIKSFCYIDYKETELTGNDIINSCANVYQMAHDGGWTYGDSQSIPPCVGDKKISCDRLPALALWNLGFTNQPKGGFTVAADRWMGAYLENWGFHKVTDVTALKAGDIVIMRNGSPTPNAGWHAFVITAVNGSLISKYDMGSQARIEAKQPFVNVPINEWGGGRAFYCAYRVGSSETDTYEFKPVTIRTGAVGKSQFSVNRILKARGYKGVKADGVLQDLELNDSFSKGDVAALVKYKWDRLINGKNLATGILADEVNRRVYEDLFGMSIPIRCVPVPDRCKSGPLILWLQEVLRSEELRGKDGHLIGLDQEWGPNTEHAVKAYQKRYGFNVTGKVDAALWKHMCTNRSIIH